MGDHLLVIGCGNALRGDDAVGLGIARALRSRLPRGVSVVEQQGDGTALIEIWRGARAVILVEAAEGGGNPGTVKRFDAAAGPLPLTLRAYSTHGFGAGEAIELARALGELPSQVLVYAIVGKRYTVGAGLSPAVKAAARQVLAEFAAEVLGSQARAT